MAKKKGLNLKLILSGVAVLLGVIAFLMMFAPAVKYTLGNSTTNYTGVQVTFGYKEKGGLTGKEYEIFKFSFMNLVPYLLVLAGVVFSVLSALGKLGNLSRIIAAACFVVAGILFFCAVSFLAYNSESADLTKAFKDDCSLAFGAILAGILSILAGASAIAPMFLKK